MENECYDERNAEPIIEQNIFNQEPDESDNDLSDMEDELNQDDEVENDNHLQRKMTFISE